MLEISQAFIQSINATNVEDIRLASKYIISTLLNKDNKNNDNFEPQQKEIILRIPALDGISSIYAEAIRLQYNAIIFREYLNSIPIQNQKAMIISDVFENSINKNNSTSTIENIKHSFLPQLTHVSWSLSHELGNRAKTPISPSVPVLDFHFTGNPCGGIIPIKKNKELLTSFSCTASQSEDLLTTLHEMLAEAERVKNIK